jgi:serine/threonine-protein kinase
MMLKMGDLFLDRYEVSHVIGRGSFGYVYRARDLKVEREVAVKFLKLDTPVAQARFEVEAKVVATLRDPATVRLYDYGRFKTVPYMILEYASGRTLRDILDWRGAFTADRTVRIMLQILGSLKEAHSLGIIHRDLKPENLVLSQPDGRPSIDRVKLLDFGVAKVMSTDGRITHPGRLTIRGTAVGTLRYMPIEQMRGGDIAPSADLFGLGVIAYEMLVGKHPYDGLRDTEIPRMLLDSTPLHLPDDTDAPPGLRSIVHGLLQKQPHHRYQEAEEVIGDIERFGAGANEDFMTTVERRRPSFLESDTGWNDDQGRSFVSVLANSKSDAGRHDDD